MCSLSFWNKCFIWKIMACSKGTSLPKIWRRFSHALNNVISITILKQHTLLQTHLPQNHEHHKIKFFLPKPIQLNDSLVLPVDKTRWLDLDPKLRHRIRLCTSTTALSVVHPHCFALTTLPQWQVGTGLPVIMSTWVLEVMVLCCWRFQCQNVRKICKINL